MPTSPSGPLFGAEPPPVHEDHVRVYSQQMQMIIAPPMLNTKALSSFGGSSDMEPPLSPSTVPLRGYAAQALAGSDAPAGRGKQTKDPLTREKEYQDMMQSILDRTRQANQQQEQDEDRRVERLLKHIEHEENFVAEVDQRVRFREQQKLDRQRELYKEWNDKVFGTIQKQIDKQLAQIRTQDLTERRRNLMEDYIRISNQKIGGLYRDIIIESEYDPFMANKLCPKYRMSDRRDPLKQELTVLDPMKDGLMGDLKPRELGRPTLDPTMYNNLHSTPYGRFDRMVAPPPPETVHFSRVNFEHYNISTDPATLRRELPRGKRMGITGMRDQHMSTIFDTVGGPL